MRQQPEQRWAPTPFFFLSFVIVGAYHDGAVFLVELAPCSRIGVHHAHTAREKQAHAYSNQPETMRFRGSSHHMKDSSTAVGLGGDPLRDRLARHKVKAITRQNSTSTATFQGSHICLWGPAGAQK